MPCPQGSSSWLCQSPFYLFCHLNNCNSLLISPHIIIFLKGKFAIRQAAMNMEGNEHFDNVPKAHKPWKLMSLASWDA